jgi:putative peptidoglycan lipid II flippase
VALVVALRLASGGTSGSVVVFTLATALFLLPWGVLAVPVATSAFPRLSASASAGDSAAYAEVAQRSLRVVLLLSAGASAVLVAVAVRSARSCCRARRVTAPAPRSSRAASSPSPRAWSATA